MLTRSFRDAARLSTTGSLVSVEQIRLRPELSNTMEIEKDWLWSGYTLLLQCFDSIHIHPSGHTKRGYYFHQPPSKNLEVKTSCTYAGSKRKSVPNAFSNLHTLCVALDGVR